VKYENQYIGRTNKRGKLLIPSVNAYYPAKFEIDPMNLSDAVRVPIVEQKVSVAAGSGYVIHFPVEMTHPIRAVLNDGAGLPITVGSHASLGSAQAIIGWDGQVYFETDLTDAPAAREILVVMPNGSSCRAPFIEQLQPQPGGETAMSDLGELPCN
jgi:outer membrane usher protein